MIKLIVSIALMLCIICTLSAQISTKKIGNGSEYPGDAATSCTKMNFRFHNAMTHGWSVNVGSLSNYDHNMPIRRFLLSPDGWAYSTKVNHKLEVGLSNRYEGGGASQDCNNAANLTLDTSITCKVDKNFSIIFGKGKLPTNRDMVISSANLQFVDRSRPNSRYHFDRVFAWQEVQTSSLECTIKISGLEHGQIN